MGRFTDWVTRKIARDAARDEQAAREPVAKSPDSPVSSYRITPADPSSSASVQLGRVRSTTDHGRCHFATGSRARRIGAEAAGDGGIGAGLAAWTRESTGATRNGRMRLPRTKCGTCVGEYVRRHDGRPNAHKKNGVRCPGGGAA